FVPRQFAEFNGAGPEKGSQAFTEKLKKRGHATWREYQNVGGVYHLWSRIIYRLTDRENLSNRYRHSTDFICMRLLLLDFILADHLNAYAPLFRHLRAFRFLYIAPSPARFGMAAERFSLLVQRPLEEVLREELERYFELRRAWDGKQYGKLSMDDLEWLDQANQRFTSRDIERLYAAWDNSEADREVWRRLFSEVYPPRAIEFRTCLLTPSASKESKEAQDGTFE